MDVLDRADLPFPHSLPEFQRLFPDDAACAAYLEQARWGDGFACPHCGTAGATLTALASCAAASAARTPPVGTVMERSHTPLNVWFWAAYLVANARHVRRAVQRQLGHETALLRSGIGPRQDRWTAQEPC